MSKEQSGNKLQDVLFNSIWNSELLQKVEDTCVGVLQTGGCPAPEGEISYSVEPMGGLLQCPITIQKGD